MKILALDCGLSTGWAVYFGDMRGRIESGVETFKARRGESPGIRFLYFRTWTERIVSRVKPDLVVYEMSIRRGGAATELQIGMTTRVQEVCSMLKTEYLPIHLGTVKKHATGSGRASKEDMIREANKFIITQKQNPKRKITSDDEADAVMILAWAIDEFEPKE